MKRTESALVLCFLWLVLLWPAGRLLAYRDLETGTFLTRDPAGMVDGPNMYSYVRQNPWTHFDPKGLWEDGPDGAMVDGGRVINGGNYWNLPETALYNIESGHGNISDEQTLKRYADTGFSDMIRPGMEHPEAVSNFLMKLLPVYPNRPSEGEDLATMPGSARSFKGNAKAELPVSKPSAENASPTGKTAKEIHAESNVQVQINSDTETTIVSPGELVSRQGPSEMTGNRVKRLTKDMKTNGFDPNYPVKCADVDGQKIIIDGHHRTEAAKKAGVEQIPAIKIQVDTKQATELSAEALDAAAEQAQRQR